MPGTIVLKYLEIPDELITNYTLGNICTNYINQSDSKYDPNHPVY